MASKAILRIIKDEKALNKYIIFLLYFGLSVTETAKALEVSRPTVYAAQREVKHLLAVSGLLDTKTKQE